VEEDADGVGPAREGKGKIPVRFQNLKTVTSWVLKITKILLELDKITKKFSKKNNSNIFRKLVAVN